MDIICKVISHAMEEFLKMKEKKIIEQLLYNIPIWLFIRSYVFWEIIKNKYNLAEAHIKRDFKNLSFKEKNNLCKKCCKKVSFQG
jgi:hypothetical protein